MSNNGFATIHIPDLDLDWQDQAACRSTSPDLFSDPALARWGLMVCEDCPLTAKQECSALRDGAQGIWGGKAYYPRRPRGNS